MPTFNMRPFDTPRLHLRPLDERDEALYCHLYTDPELMRHIAEPLAMERVQRSFRAALKQQSTERQRWIIVEREPNLALGLLGLFVTGDSAEMGVMLLAESQGRGFATEAMAAMRDRTFKGTQVRLLWIRQEAENEPVVGMMQRLGFEPLPPDASDPNGRRWDLSRERWARAPQVAVAHGTG